MERDGDDASSSDPDPREDDILFSALVGALSRGVDASKAREVVRQQSVPPPIGLGPSWAATAAALAEDETRRRRAREALTVRVALPPAEDEDEDDDDASTLSRSEASASSHHGNLASKLETLARRAFDGPRDRLGGKAERFADANGASLAAPQLVRASWDGARRARSKSVENARERVTTNDDDPPLYNPSVAATRPRAPGVAWGPPRAPPDAIRRSATKRGSLTCVLTLVPIRPRSRCERRSLRTLPGVSLRPPLAFIPPRRLSTPTDAFELHPAIRLYRTSLSAKERREEDARTLVAALPFESGIAAAIRGAPRHAPRATSTCTPYHAAITPPRHQRTYP